MSRIFSKKTSEGEREMYQTSFVDEDESSFSTSVDRKRKQIMIISLSN